MSTRETAHVLAFAPAPVGWRAVYVYEDEGGGHELVPVAGWISLEGETGSGNVGVFAAVVHPDSPAELMAVDAIDIPGYYADFWKVLGPGESDPTDAEVARRRADETASVAASSARRERRRQREAEEAVARQAAHDVATGKAPDITFDPTTPWTD